MVSSDPKYPVYDSYQGKIGRTKSGLFSILMPLKVGENTLSLTQNDKTYSLRVTRKNSVGEDESLSGFVISSVSPKKDSKAIVASGDSLPISVTAPSGSVVTATLGGKSITLTPTLKPKGNSPYLKEVFCGEITVPIVREGEDYSNVGTVSITCVRDGKTVTSRGPAVYVIPTNLQVSATVIKDYSYLKISPESSFYEDFTPASAGMTDEVRGIYSDYVRLGFGGYISKEDVRIEKSAVPSSNLSKVEGSATDKLVTFTLDFHAAPALNATVEKSTVVITFYQSMMSVPNQISLPEGDLLFSSAKLSYGSDHCVKLIFELISPMNYYGFDYSYENGTVILRFSQPQKRTEGELPLKGKTVVVDAGHGGKDCGALGYFSGINEEDLNLSVALALAQELKGYGANVILSRETDVEVSLEERMDLLTKINPDFSISVHHNSTAETADANEAKGTLGLYWSHSGISLAKSIQESTNKALNSVDLDIRKQKLALCRNYRFPQTLIELSYVCSPEEYHFSMRSDYVKKCAKAIANGVILWYDMQEDYLGGA
jgi:N-acetylmuramoyl-L-alanine amidase